MLVSNQVLISVIVPIYKVEKFLSRCVTSIMEQSYKNLEIILVDDGSPDECPAICEEFAKKDSRVVVIHKENGGLSDARNIGLDMAKGDFISFVDGDDYIAPNMFETLITAALTNDADIAICNYIYVDENNCEIKSKVNRRYATDKKFTRNEFIQELIQPYGGYFVVVWNKLYKKNIFKDLRFPIGKQHEDEFVIHYIIDKSDIIVSVKDALYYYLQREGSIMSNNFNVKNLDYGDALIDRYHFTKKNKYHDWRNQCAFKLSFELDKWKGYAFKDQVIKKKYDEIRKKSLFLLFERYAWNGYDNSTRLE